VNAVRFHPGFNAREVVDVESDTPVAAGPVDGEARIVDELPSRVIIELRMRTAGGVVLADRWAPGWNAYLAGHPAPLPVLRANHALRGVSVPSGDAVLEFRYANRRASRGDSTGRPSPCCS
jgi:hypothetical protein